MPKPTVMARICLFGTFRIALDTMRVRFKTASKHWLGLRLATQRLCALITRGVVRVVGLVGAGKRRRPDVIQPILAEVVFVRDGLAVCAVALRYICAAGFACAVALRPACAAGFACIGRTRLIFRTLVDGQRLPWRHVCEHHGDDQKYGKQLV